MADFAEITVSYERDGQPQLATGSARLDWKKQLQGKLQLTSRWLDLDRVAGRTEQSKLPELIERLAKSIDATIPESGQSTVSLDLDQATLGGDVISKESPFKEMATNPEGKVLHLSPADFEAT